MNSRVERLTDPRHLTERPLQRLFYDAFQNNSIYPEGFGGIIEDLLALIVDPKVVVLVGTEGETPSALSIILFPNNKLAPNPQILHFYNGGSVALRKKLLKTMSGVVKAMGYTKVWGVNATDKPDSVWARLWEKTATARRLGGLMELTLKD